MEVPSNAAHAATPATGSGVVLPANWWDVAAYYGQDPALVAVYKDVYGWQVGTHVESLPVRTPRVVDATVPLTIAHVVLALGVILALTAKRKPSHNHNPQESTQ